MFKHIFILGLVAGAFGTLVSLLYAYVYKTLITVDYTEVASIAKLTAHNFMFTMASCFLYFGLLKINLKENIASFVLNFLISGACIGLVFFQLTQPNPVFKNEDTNLMADFFNGFFMPLIFFPALSWFAFKPLIINNK